MYDIKYNDVKVINSIYDMYKNKRHILKRECGYIDEKKYLEYYFKWYTFFFFFGIIG